MGQIFDFGPMTNNDIAEMQEREKKLREAEESFLKNAFDKRDVESDDILNARADVPSELDSGIESDSEMGGSPVNPDIFHQRPVDGEVRGKSMVQILAQEKINAEKSLKSQQKTKSVKRGFFFLRGVIMPTVKTLTSMFLKELKTLVTSLQKIFLMDKRIKITVPIQQILKDGKLLIRAIIYKHNASGLYFKSKNEHEVEHLIETHNKLMSVKFQLIRERSLADAMDRYVAIKKTPTSVEKEPSLTAHTKRSLPDFKQKDLTKTTREVPQQTEILHEDDDDDFSEDFRQIQKELSLETDDDDDFEEDFSQVQREVLSEADESEGRFSHIEFPH